MKHPVYGPENFAREFSVSRETLGRLSAYAALLEKWNPKINLIGADTIPSLWKRHIADSAQLFTRIPQDSRNLVDVGSGAGFPGLVLAIMGVPDVHLIESDKRKCAFLTEAARIAGARVAVHPERIERVSAFPASVLTARALAPVSQILSWAESFLSDETLCLFLKGQSVEGELTDAHKVWTMKSSRWPSATDPTGSILALQEVRRVPAPAGNA